MKEDNKNKLKQFVKKHELAFAIAGGVVILVAGVGIGYGICRNPKRMLERYSDVIEECKKGTRDIAIWNCDPNDVTTVAEVFGKNTADFIAGSEIQPDDVLASIVYVTAKKAET